MSVAEEQGRVEAALRERVSAERLQGHLDVFSRLFRDSGSPDEWRAAEYVRETLAGYGVAAEVLSFESLISWPLEGSLVVLDGAGGEAARVPVRTRSFGVRTPPGGIEAELVHVPFEAPERGAMIFSHRAGAGDYRGLGVAAEVLSFESLISWPLEGSLVVLDGAGGEAARVPVRTRSFGVRTPPGGIEAELVHVPFEAPERGAMIFSHRAVAGDYRGLDVAGKVGVTMDGGAAGAGPARERGAVGLAHISTSDPAGIQLVALLSSRGAPTA